MARLSFVILLLLSALPSQANSDECTEALKPFLQNKALLAAEIPHIRGALETFRVLKGKAVSTYFTEKKQITLASGATFEQNVMSPETVEAFYKDFNKLTNLRESIDNLPLSFKAWWEKNREFYLSSGSIQNIFSKSRMNLGELHSEIYYQYVASEGALRRPSWTRRMLDQFRPSALLGTFVLRPAKYIMKEFKTIVVIGTGVAIYSAWTSTLTNPIVEKARQNGAEFWGPAAKRVNDWLASRPVAIGSQNDLKNAVDDIAKFDFYGMDQAKVQEIWEDFEKNRLYPLLLNNLKAMPAHLRDMRYFLKDIVLETPEKHAVALSTFDQQYWLHKDKHDAVLALKHPEPSDLQLRDYHKQMMDAAESSSAAVLVAWRLTELLYPDVARDRNSKAATASFHNGYIKFSKMYRFDIYVHQYIRGLQLALKELDLVYLSQDELANVSDSGKSFPDLGRGPNSVSKAKKLKKKETEKESKSIQKKKADIGRAKNFKF